jgi:hypothetical protein
MLSDDKLQTAGLFRPGKPVGQGRLNGFWAPPFPATRQPRRSIKMIGRRAIAGLALLCALVFSAFASQSAFAEIPETTAFECTKSAITKDFADAHCDTTKAGGEFGHKPLGAGPVKVTVTNIGTKGGTKEATSSTLTGEVALTKTAITCTNVGGTGELTNEEPAAGKMQVKGPAKTEFSGCTVEKPLKCVVAEPIIANSTAVTQTNLGAGKNEMGLVFSPETGTTFATIEYLNKGAEACGLNKQKFNVEGKATGTGSLGSSEAQKESGATLILGPDNALTLGGKPANFTATVTVKVAATGNAVSLTTPPYHP